MNYIFLFTMLPMMLALSRYKKCTLFLLALSIIVIACGTEGISDYWAYYEMYINNMDYPNPLYASISKFFSYHHCSYNLFRFCWIIFSLICIFYPAKRLLDDSNQIIFLIIFGITQLCIEIIQIRNLMIVALFSLGFFVLAKGKWYSNILYLVCMVCGIGVHQIAYIFIPLVFLPYIVKFRYKGYLMIFWIVMCIVLCFFSKEIINLILTILPAGILYEKLVYYSLHDKMRWGYLAAFVLHSCIIYILFIFYKNVVKKKYRLARCDSKFRQVSSLIRYELMANIYMMIIWPLVRIDLNYIRFFRVIGPMASILILAGVGMPIFSQNLSKKERIIIKILLFIYIMLCFYLYILRASDEMNIFSVTLMAKNWILKR